MHAPWPLHIGYHHLIPPAPKLHALGAVIKIPFTEKVFPPGNIVLCHHQKAVYRIHFHIRQFIRKRIGKQFSLIDMLLIQHSIPVRIPHHTCGRHLSHPHVSDHADLWIRPENTQTFLYKIRIDYESVMMQVHLILCLRTLHCLIVGRSQRLRFLNCQHVDLYAIRHTQMVDIMNTFLRIHCIIRTDDKAEYVGNILAKLIVFICCIHTVCIRHSIRKHPFIDRPKHLIPVHNTEIYHSQ